MKYIFSQLVKLWKWELDLYFKYVNWVFKKVGLLILLVSFAFGQDAGNPFWFSDEFRNDVAFKPADARFITLGDLLDYAEECYADTIRLEKFGDEEYLLMHEYYGEVFTERQLEEKGYYYSYRWITNTVIDEDNPMEFEYIFIGKPTLKGFIEWIGSKQ